MNKRFRKDLRTVLGCNTTKETVNQPGDGQVQVTKRNVLRILGFGLNVAEKDNNMNLDTRAK
jgi:hypothetical protein